MATTTGAELVEWLAFEQIEPSTDTLLDGVQWQLAQLLTWYYETHRDPKQTQERKLQDFLPQPIERKPKKRQTPEEMRAVYQQMKRAFGAA